MSGRRPFTLPSVLIACVAVAWLAVGLVSAYSYVHRYDVYRGFPAPVTPAGIDRGTVRTKSFYSTALGQRHDYKIYLPPHYAQEAARGRRFPVLYLLHGNPGQPRVFIDAGALAVAADVLVAHHRMRPMILVMPAGKRSLFHGDTEWANAGAGRWMDWVLEVVRHVDRHYAVRADRRHRGIAGLSEGGYGAMNIALRHLSMFSVAESWSGYFRQDGQGVFHNSPRPVVDANSPADYVGSLAPRIRLLGFRAWLYQGRTDTTDPALIRGFSAQLQRAGADVHFGFFPGGHDWAIWRRQLPHMLVVASRWFSRSPAGQARLRQVGSALPLATLERIKARRQQRCLHKHLSLHTHIGLGCRLYRAHHGLKSYPRAPH